MNSPALRLPSPIVSLPDFSHSYNVFVKQEDLIHREFGGNKWRKLKYNIKNYHQQDYKTMITFGGPFSNHIAASASVCKAYDIPSVGIIRGTYKDPGNPTLLMATNNGMKLHHVPKSDYRLKIESELVQRIINRYKKPMIVPEGGNNAEGIEGMRDLMVEIYNYPVTFDIIAVAAGTGATAAGIINYAKVSSDTKVIIINVLKNESLTAEIKSKSNNEKLNWQVTGDYHFGGYAKTTEELRLFAQQFLDTYNMRLDHIYNSKLFYAMRDMLDKDFIRKGSNVLLINTGGHQGIRAYNYVNGKPWLTSSV